MSQIPQRTFFTAGKKKENLKLYDVLGVPQTATKDEIKKSFFKLAKKYHPDVNKEPGAQAKYVEINEAYETLGNESKRRIYDSTGMSSNE